MLKLPLVKSTAWWLYFTLVLGSGFVIVDHLLTPHIHHLRIESLDHSYERSGKRWRTRSEIVNAHVLSLSDGSALQMATLNDRIAVGDTIELQRTAILGEPLRFRKKRSRVDEWQVVDSYLPDHRPYPYIVFFCALLLLFPWAEGPWRWSLNAALIFVLFGWFMTLIGTGVLARLYRWF